MTSWTAVCKRTGFALLAEASVGRRGAGGLASSAVRGFVGVVFGIIALLVGPIRATFGSVARMGFGGALLLGSLARRRLASIGTQVCSGGEALVGYAAVLLGYLALIGFASVPLVLVGILGVGAALLLSGSTLIPSSRSPT